MYIKNGRYNMIGYTLAESSKQIIEEAQKGYYTNKKEEKERIEKYLLKLATEIILNGEGLTGIRNLIKERKKRKEIKQSLKEMNGGLNILIDEFCKKNMIAYPRVGGNGSFKELFLDGHTPVALGGELGKNNYKQVINRAILEIIKSSKVQSRKVGRFALDYIGGNLTDENIETAKKSAEEARKLLNDAENLAQVLYVKGNYKKMSENAAEMAKVAGKIANVSMENRKSYKEQLENIIKGIRIKVGKHSLNPFIKGHKKLSEKSAGNEAKKSPYHEEH